MDNEFIERVRTAEAWVLADMLAIERDKFHAIAAEHYAGHAWLSCVVQSSASSAAEMTQAGIKQLARDVQSLRGRMDAIEERIGLIRASLHREVVRP